MVNEINLKKIRYIARRISHHAEHSGYDILFPTLGIEPASSNISTWFTKLLPAALRWRLHRLRPQQVHDQGLLPELKALPFTLFGKIHLCHFIYGEDTFLYTPLWVNKRCKLVGSYHYPESFLVERVNPAVIHCLDAVIILANSQRAYFERFLDRRKIHFIPHHVDTDFFIPEKLIKEQTKEITEYRIISIGHFLRDFKLLHKVIEAIGATETTLPVHFDLVIPKNKQAEFCGYNNIRLHAGISDNELRQLYQRATIGFMPLIDCAANNSVLEMMATGLPIICSDVGGISDYLDENGALLFTKNTAVANLKMAVLDLLADQQKRSGMGEHNRKKAVKEFSFNVCREKMLELYERLLNQ